MLLKLRRRRGKGASQKKCHLSARTPPPAAAAFLQQQTLGFLPTPVALTVLSRILQHNRLPRRTLHHVHHAVPQVWVAWQVSIYLRVRPRRRHAGGLNSLWISLCDLLLHQTLRCCRASSGSSSSSTLPVHNPQRRAAATVWACPRAAASAPTDPLLIFEQREQQVRQLSSHAPLLGSSLPPSL